MKTKPKKCKGINKAHGFDGCGKLSEYREAGLCPVCFYEWMTTTENGLIHKSKVFDIKVSSKTTSRRKENDRQKRNELKLGNNKSKFKFKLN